MVVRLFSLVKKILKFAVVILLVAAVVGPAYRWRADKADLETTPAPGKLVDVGGHRLHIWCSGPVDPTKPTVLFDSGLGGGAFSWAKIAPEVAKFTQACTYDRAGMGYSEQGPMPRTSAQIAKELSALIESSEISRPVVLVGLSFGGYNTRIVSSERPDLVAGLVLVSASHEDQGERYRAAGLSSGKPPEIVIKAAPFVAFFGIPRMLGVTLGTSPDRAPAEIRDYVRATIYQASRYQTMGSELLHTTQSGRDVAATRHQLDTPLVVVSAGMSSRTAALAVDRELQADMVTLSTRACQVIAEESGHGIGRQPELVIQAIRDVMVAARDGTHKPGC